MAETTTTASPGGWRMPLALRIFLLLAVLLGLAVLATVLITKGKAKEVADEAISRTLTNSVEVQKEFAQRRLEGLQLKIQVIAGDTAFVNYVSESLGGGLGLGTEGIVDQGSVADQLKERQQNVGFDLGILIDPKSKVVTRTDETEAFDKSMEGDPFVEAAQKSLQPLSGYWRQGGKLYQAAIMPLQQDTKLVAFLMLADAVNDEAGKRVGKVSGADIAYLLPSDKGVTIAGSSFDASVSEQLAAAINAGPVADAVKKGEELPRSPLSFGSQDWVASVMPLDKDAGPLVGSSLALTSPDRITAGYRGILNQVALAGGLFLLIALPASFVLAKVTLRPVRAMARAAKEAAAGNYQTMIGIKGDDELADLSHSFDSLLSDLRERKDIEGYVSNLSRFLPDPGQAEDVPSFVTQQMGGGTGGTAAVPAQYAPAPLAPPRRESLLLLGLDLREAARPLAEESAEDLLARISTHSTQILSVAARARGKAVALAGARLVLGFSGDDRLRDALGVCRAAMEADPAIAAAALEGEVVHGSVNAGSEVVRTTAGVAGYQLERLIAESHAGKLLLPKSLGEASKGLLGDASVAVIQGAVSGKSFYGVDREHLPEPVLDETPAGPADEHATVATPTPSPAVQRATRGTEIRPGMRLGGRYDILSVLGEGGMGVVYKARDIELDDVVALKMLKPAALVDSEQLERLKTEIKLARKITHPNVLRTFDFGEAMGLPYISMEYVRGMTLRYLLRQAGRIPYSAALRIARQLAAGLAAAHSVGVLHRDIKPENLILEANGNAKLMDFGIARPATRAKPGHTQPGMFVGTPHYSAPEQLTGEEVDHRADIYSSGVLLCEMFSGKLPFNGANTMEIYMAQMSSEPIKPSAYWPEIPPALEQIILKCINRKADERYQSAQELGDALGALRA